MIESICWISLSSARKQINNSGPLIYIKQGVQGILLLFLVFKSINTNEADTIKILRIVNYSAMGISLGNLVIDSIKMPFTLDKIFNTTLEQDSVVLPTTQTS